MNTVVLICQVLLAQALLQERLFKKQPKIFDVLPHGIFLTIQLHKV